MLVFGSVCWPAFGAQDALLSDCAQASCVSLVACSVAVLLDSVRLSITGIVEGVHCSIARATEVTHTADLGSSAQGQKVS